MTLQSQVEKAVYELTASVQDMTDDFDGGAAAIARELGAKPRSMNNKVSPDYTGSILNIRDLIGIMMVLDEAQRHHILIALNQLFGHVCMPVGKLTEVGDEALIDSWAKWDAERGETAEKIREALSDRNRRTNKSISNNEFRTIRREMIEDIQKELELLRRLEVF